MYLKISYAQINTIQTGICIILILSSHLFFNNNLLGDVLDLNKTNEYCTNEKFRRNRFARYCRRLWFDNKSGYCGYFKDRKKFLSAYQAYCLKPTGKLKLAGPELGTISIESKPSRMKVYLDDSFKGLSPLSIDNLRPNYYQVRLLKDAYYPWEDRVRLVRGQKIKLDIKAELITVDVAIRFNVKKAAFSVGGVYYGTGNMNIKLPLGKHQLKAWKQGYIPNKRTVFIKQDQKERVSFKLEQGFETTNMVSIPAGKYSVVYQGKQGMQMTLPAKYLDHFFIDKHEVTIKEYRECVDAGKCKIPKTGKLFNWKEKGSDGGGFFGFGKTDYNNYPVNGVSLLEAIAYCTYKYKRLPTEAEWQKAASWKDGKRQVYPNGKAIINCDTAVMQKKSFFRGGPGCGKKESWPVKSKPIEINGTFDMAGNVWEWTSESLTNTTVKTKQRFNPKTIKDNDPFIVKGGSYQDDMELLSVEVRRQVVAKSHLPELGFRCVVTP